MKAVAPSIPYRRMINHYQTWAAQHADNHPLFVRDELIFRQRNLSINHTSFEQQYTDLRNREARRYPDDVVRRLPRMDAGHPQASEWSSRTFSSGKLIRHLSKTKPERVLEIGCGNGWLSHLLSTSLNCEVCGIDINLPEIRQAARVFASNQKLTFVGGEFEILNLEDHSIDAIVLAASMQYFSKPQKILLYLLNKLRTGGAIHIIDTPFYRSDIHASEARRRSQQHFERLGCPAMADYYFHHTWTNLAQLPVTVKADPTSLDVRIMKRLGRNTFTFPWLMVKAHA